MRHLLVAMSLLVAGLTVTFACASLLEGAAVAQAIGDQDKAD
jgi:hypothetical protein